MAGLLLFYHGFTLKVLGFRPTVPWCHGAIGCLHMDLSSPSESVPRAATLSKGIVLSTLTAPRHHGMTWVMTDVPMGHITQP